MKRELTVSSITIGIIIGVIMTAANVYLGLYAGMTVSASIPASVLAMGIYRGILRRPSIYESNIVQTMASAGESLAAGIIFSIPALVIVGAWNDFAFWPTTLIAMCGGLLGVLFMIPLRKALIVENKELIYPEGVACSQVLKSGSSEEGGAGFVTILKGLFIGGLFKFTAAAMGLFQGSVEGAVKLGQRVLFLGGDASPALLAVGYIVGLEIAALVLMGGALAWWVAIPMMGIPAGMENASALDIAWTLWSAHVRYIGVGAMIVGGIASLFSVRKTLGQSIRSMKDAYNSGEKEREESPGEAVVQVVHHPGLAGTGERGILLREGFRQHVPRISPGRGLRNIQFRHGAIEDLERLGLGAFDYIDCCGVLQWRSGDLHASGKIAYRTTDSFAATGAGKVLDVGELAGRPRRLGLSPARIRGAVRQIGDHRREIAYYQTKVAPDGSLWIGTAGGGLLRRRAGTFAAVDTLSGLPSMRSSPTIRRIRSSCRS